MEAEVIVGPEFAFPRGAVIMVGVMAPHDSAEADKALMSLIGTIAARRDMPLVLASVGFDCLVSPPERGSAHFEVAWLQV